MGLGYWTLNYEVVHPIVADGMACCRTRTAHAVVLALQSLFCRHITTSITKMELSRGEEIERPCKAMLE